MLIDANIQDTVLDTPMNNYAVLTSGSNGNLVGTGAGSLVGTVKGDNWYCEVMPTAGTTNSDGNNVMHIQVFDENNSEVLVWRSDTGDTYTVGDVVGISIKNNVYQWYKNGSAVSQAGSGSTVPGNGSVTGTFFTTVFLNGGAASSEAAYNFGQQPFVYATTQPDGTVMLNAKAPNYDQKWSDNTSASVTPGTVSATTNAFDGDLSTRLVSDQNNSTLTVTIDPAITVQEGIRIYTGNFNDITVNGITKSSGGDANEAYWVSFPGAQSLSSITCVPQNINSRGNLRAIEVDGRLLIDGPADNSRVWSNGISY